MSSAFDAIDHDILLKRLEHHFGITGSAIEWIESYLKQRSFSVLIKGCHGKMLNLLFGVPQGSLLGPLLFILYTKEIETIALSYGMLVQLYADDSQIYVELKHGTDWQNNKYSIEACLSEIQSWMYANYLKINESKTDLIIFNPARQPYNVSSHSSDFNIDFNNNEVQKSESVTVLGLTLTANINLKSFITLKCKSCNFQLQNLKSVKNSLDQDLRFMLINSLVLSKLDYCNAVLAACTQTEIQRLQVVMNDCVRFVFSLRRNVHITEYRKRLHLLPVKHRIVHKLCTLAHKIVNGIAPSYLCEMYQCYMPTANMTLRYGVGRDNLMLQFVGGELPNKCVFLKLMNTWNTLPVSLRSVNPADKFKKQLKTHLFREAYPESD